MKSGKSKIGRWLLVAAGGLVALAPAALGGHGMKKQGGEAAKEMAPVPPPTIKGLKVLFGGKQEDMTANWVRSGSDQPPNWKFTNGAMEVSGRDIESKEKFTNYQLHLEFREPFMPNAHGQERGNSGVFLHGHHEIQVLDSFGFAEPGTGDCGAVYNQAAPLVNACKPPLQWQTYDITFRAPRYDANGKKVENARVSVLLNGIVIQNNQEINGPTDGYTPKSDADFNQPWPLRLQDHGNKVQYRNIWVLPLPPQGASHYDPK